MEYWFETVGKEFLQTKLSKVQMLEWGCLCVEHAFKNMVSIFTKRVDPNKVLKLDRALQIVRSNNAGARGSTVSDAHELLKEIQPEPDSKEDITEGWVAILDAAYYLCKGYDEDNPSLSLQLASSGAYYCIVKKEYNAYMRQHKCGLAGEEHDMVEKSSPDCLAELAFQKMSLDKVLRGL